MKKLNKERAVTFLIILIVIALALVLLNNKKSIETDKEIAKCIGQKSILYTRLGCHFCETQKDIFGENYNQLTLIDCFFDQEKCINENITATPTWVIKGKEYVGVQSIEKLKELTEC